jgi:hypothetical protein
MTIQLKPEQEHRVAEALRSGVYRGSRKPPIALIDWELSLIVQLPFGHIFTALIASLSTYFRSRAALQLEILALRH